MFGKPQWFRLKTASWGLHPIAWQGWVYSIAWMGVIAAPFLALISRHQAPESLVWLTASLSALALDVRSIRKSLQPQADRAVLYIGEDGASEQYISRPCQPQAGK